VSPTVGVSVASIPPRGPMLAKALSSVCRQTRPADQIIVHVDRKAVGAAEAKNTALQAVTTDWVAFLDDDDELLPHHLEHLLAVAESTGADLVYPWFQGCNSEGIFAAPDENGTLVSPAGLAFNQAIHPDYLRTAGNFIPTTVLVRTDLVRQVGGFVPKGDLHANPCDDWGLWIRLLDAGARFVHLPEITWQWNASPYHTSGRPWREVPIYAGHPE
jgi:glycosyltransferase involved in cell wall biosynthesis